jgi:beta-lactamase class A
MPTPNPRQRLRRPQARRVRPKGRFARFGLLLSAGLLTGLVSLLALGPNAWQPMASPAEAAREGLAANAATTDPTAAAQAVDQFSPGERLSHAITPQFGDLAGRLGLVVEHVPSGARVEQQAARRFTAASVYKLTVAYEVLEQVDQGLLALDDLVTLQQADLLDYQPGELPAGQVLTIRRALETMLGDSSNTAAFALLRTVGRPRLNATLVRLGLQETSVPLLAGESALPGSAPHDRELAVTSAADMARLLRLLATEQLLRPASRQELRRLLAQEEPADPLRAGVPARTPVLAKAGNLPGISNVVGLIETSSGPVIVAVLTQAVDPAQARRVIADIGRSIDRLYSPQPSGPA